MSTTKLTRKEILAEDPVHHTMIRLLELFRERGKLLAAAAAGVAILVLGIYFGLGYWEARDLRTQQQLGKAMDFFHARIDSTALDDPYGKGGEPIFRSEEAKYRAAEKEFSAIASSGSTKLSVMARYYLGLTQLQLGKRDEGVRSLEAVRNSNANRTLSYLAKKVLAEKHLESKNYKAAAELLEGMIKDPQCEVPKAALQLSLARALEGQGKREEAMKMLREARDAQSRSMLLSMVMQELNRLEGNSR